MTWLLVISRLRKTATLTALRLIGLTLAALLAASVPTFVAASMEHVLHREVAATEEPLTVVAAWTAPDDASYASRLADLDAYLRDELPRVAGFSADRVEAASLLATAPVGAQRVEGGKVQAGRRYLKLAPLPDGLKTVAGRMPAPGQPEVVVPDGALEKNGYEIGTTLRLPYSGLTVDVSIVGTVKAPETGASGDLAGAMSTALMTSPEFWQAQDLPVGEQTWALQFPTAQLHASGVSRVLAAWTDLPLRLVQFLPDAELVTTPVTWLAEFARQMAATQRFLLVLLTPVFLLVLFLVVATANVLVDSRRTEIAVLRSRGMTPLRVIAFYLPESLLLAMLSLGAGLALTLPAVRVMSLSAGFLQLVGRPPIPVAITAVAVAYAATAAVVAELVALLPLGRAARFTVATIRQEAETRSVFFETVRAVGEVLLLAVLGYGTWRLRTAGADAASDPLFLALPSLALAGAGVIALRAFELLLSLLNRFVRTWLSPPYYLAVSLLRGQSGRYRALSLMLVLTSGLGIYGAAFARTLDRDLVARSQYRLGADISLRAVWESEVTSMASDGSDADLAYREPPYDDLLGLPGAAATTRVQTRKGVSFTSGNRNLGKADLIGLEPQGFAKAARFLSELTPNAGEHLNALATDERSVLLSSSMAQRLGLKPGDQLKAKQESGEALLTVAGVVSYWPGRLPEQGDFVVGSLTYFQDSLSLAPHEVWIRMEQGASATDLYLAVKERGVRITAVDDSRLLVAAGRRQPFRLGIYATLSAGFLVALFVMALTYLLTVGLSLQSRAKELGVLRAMGMPERQVALSLYTEQLLLMAAAAATGLLAGAQAAALYVPVLRQQPGETLLPLRVASVAGERLWLAAAFGLALAVGAGTVAVWLKRLNLNAVLRLGEDG